MKVTGKKSTVENERKKLIYYKIFRRKSEASIVKWNQVGTYQGFTLFSIKFPLCNCPLSSAHQRNTRFGFYTKNTVTLIDNHLTWQPYIISSWRPSTGQDILVDIAHINITGKLVSLSMCACDIFTFHILFRASGAVFIICEMLFVSKCQSSFASHFKILKCGAAPVAHLVKPNL